MVDASTGSTAASATSAKSYKAPQPKNSVLRMMGLPNLPKKLPSRNWLIFWTLSTTLAGALVYDAREKRRATAKWRRVVAELGRQPIGPEGHEMPRRMTVFLESPPGDGLRAAQDHFIEFVKPVLADSGLDWDFVQGRQQGDVRAAVAEKIRRERSQKNQPPSPPPSSPLDLSLLSEEEKIAAFRREKGIPEYDGIRGDLVIGRHTWKEYIRGLHEGWLGPLERPAYIREIEAKRQKRDEDAVVEKQKLLDEAEQTGGEDERKKVAQKQQEEAEEAEKKKKNQRPPQPLPYNSVDEYAAAPLPSSIPDILTPTTVITLPHILGFTRTPIRLKRFFQRRKLADDIGRQVAAACFGVYEQWPSAETETSPTESSTSMSASPWTVLAEEEQYWPKWVGQDEKSEEEIKKRDADFLPPKEQIWASPITLDARLADRLRRFTLEQAVQQKADAVVVPESEVEGRVKNFLRNSLVRLWAAWA